MNIPPLLKGAFRGLIGLLIVLLLAVPGSASQPNGMPLDVEAEPALALPQTNAGAATPPARGLSDRTELAAFMDDIFNSQIAAQAAPGAVVAVVKDGELWFAKGYGYADLDRQIPVDAEKTLFRVASISKLFTATATLQLQEQGLLNLEDDITAYLGDRVRLDNPFPAPVTFAQLLTHTDGSTKRRLGLAAPTAAKLQSLENYLTDHLPPIVYPPGKLFSYSSHSMALLGYLVQRIADQPFEDYIDEHILRPLGMNRSSFAQPSPHADDLATGYQQRGKTFEPVPYLYLNIGPAAALSSTATDMAHFMIAHLQGGQYQDQRILEPESVAAMHRIHFRSHPDLPGTGYGFRERQVNGLSALGHLGSLRGYSSSLTLLPEQNVGLFMASNSLSGVHGQVIWQFFNHYFPAETDDAKAVAVSATAPSPPDLERFTGTYRDLEYPRHTIGKLTAPFRRIHIKRGKSGLEIETPSLFFRSSMPNSQLELIGPMLFRHRDDGTLTAFEADEQGDIRYAHNPVFAKMGTYTKIAWYEGVLLHGGLFIGAMLIFLTGVWVWPLHPILHRLRGKSLATPLPHASAWRLAGLVSSLNLIFLIGFPLSLWRYGAWKLAYGMPWFGIAFLTLPIAAALLTVGMGAIALLAWYQSWWTVIRRGHYTLLALAAVLSIALLSYWRVLGFQI